MINNEKIILKNIAQSTFEETKVDDGFLVLTYKNDGNETQNLVKEINSDYIQFHYCIKGSSKFVFNEGRYMLKYPRRKLVIVVQSTTRFTY